MEEEGCQTIEQQLGVKLPDAYRAFQLNRSASPVDPTTVADDARVVVERTLEHRRGFGGAPPWPRDVIYMGDEDDACPYALFCSTGRVIQTDHGDLQAQPLCDHPDFGTFVEQFQAEAEHDAGAPGIISVVMAVIPIVCLAAIAILLNRFTPLPFWACFVLAVPLFLLLWGGFLLVVSCLLRRRGKKEKS